MRTLVIAAHPDDEVLGCGGTIARLARDGTAVKVIILSDGESSRWQSPGDVPGEVVESRRAAARKAAAILGVEAPMMFDYPDNRFDTVPLLEITKTVESVIREFEPDTVFTHHSGDMNVDHRLTAEAVMTATRPAPESSVERVYSFEVLSSTHVAAGHFGRPFLPNVMVEISDTIEDKLEAMKCYERELHPFPHPRSLESIRSLASMRGTVCAVAAAEAFVLVREIRRGGS
ncbi:MAG TPA: PIG-L deacetylase family protein [Rhodothermales bacterium]|nr:PIG-L deacetylase family protein [Rhodothermales bacterium]